MPNGQFNTSEVIGKTNFPWFHFAVMIGLSLTIAAITYKQPVMGVILWVSIYLSLCTSFRRGIFKREGLKIQYPFRPLFRSRLIKHGDLKCFRRGHGTYLDGELLIVEFLIHKNHAHHRKAIALMFPEEKEWGRIKAYYAEISVDTN